MRERGAAMRTITMPGKHADAIGRAVRPADRIRARVCARIVRSDVPARCDPALRRMTEAARNLPA